MDDIAPGLLEEIQRTFRELLGSSPKIRKLSQLMESGAGTYADAQRYAYEVGRCLSKALSQHITADILPDGRMYYNIAEKVLRPLLSADHDLVSQAAQLVQQSLNRAAGIGLAVQTVPMDEDRVMGIINRLSAAPEFREVSWLLGAPVQNFSLSVVDDTLAANVNFQGRAGLRPRITRIAEPRCCKWCSSLDGIYDYPNVPQDVYRRHERCRCLVEYNPGSGRRQDVHSKRWS